MKAKKVLAMLMASAMIMGTSVTAFAETPSSRDEMDVMTHIKNLNENVEITAYRIIEPKYTDDGFVGYKWADSLNSGADITFKNENIVGLDEAFITGLAANSEELKLLTKEVKQSDADTFNLEVGTWLLLVKGTADVYNPMIISVYYDTEKGSGSSNDMKVGNVDADGKWTIGATTAYAKSTEIDITKTVDSEDEDAEVGSSVGFTITGTIPAYSDQYKNVKYNLKDTFVNGLTMEKYDTTYNGNTISVPAKEAPEVYVGGTAEKNKVVAGEAYIYTPFKEGDKIGTDKEGAEIIADSEGFLIEFTETYIKTLKNATEEERAVVVKYEATVTADAIIKPAENDVDLDYQRTPGETTSTEPVKEYVYSVSFDGVAQKVGDNKQGLEGATFTLYRNYTDANENAKPDADELSGEVGSYVTKSSDNYDIEFKGLDADVPYYLTETAAPAGYTINDTVYTITFTNLVDNGNGNVTYDVWVDGEFKNTITYGSPAGNFGMQVENTKLSSLPSTGGIGTTIFTIGGCTIMVTAAGLYFATRKKTEK